MKEPSRINQELIKEKAESKHKRTKAAFQENEQNYRLLATYYKQLNNISITFTEASDTEDLFNRIAESFLLLTDAIAATFAIYDQKTRALKVAALSTDPISRDKIDLVFGHELFEMHMPVSQDDMTDMLKQGIRKPKDLCELSFGVMPQEISDAIMDAVGCRQIIALAISYAEELIGTCIAYLPGDRQSVPDDALKTYIYLSGMAVKRKQAEEMLRRSEENFRHSLDDSPMGVRIVTPEGETIYANRAILDIYGYDNMEDLKTTSVKKRYTPESHADFLIRREKRQQGNDVPSEYTIDIIRKDGEVRRLQVFRKEILWNGEKQFQVLYKDITERTQAAEVLRESEIRYRELFESMQSGVSVYETRNNGEDFIFKEYNAAAEMLDKTHRGKAIGRSVVDVFPGVKDFGLFDVFQRVYRTGKPERHPITFYKDKKIGGWRENYVYKLPSGEIVAVFEDITQRKQAEEMLRQSEERWRSLVSNSPDFIALHDREGKFLFLNHYAEGFAGKDVLGKKGYEFVSQNSREIYMTAFEECIRKMTKQHAEYSAMGNNGKERRYESTFVPIIGCGNEINVLVVAKDITARMREEEELSTSRLQLRALYMRLQQIREEESIRIAREIHDEMGGGLTGLKMDLSWLLHKIGETDLGEERVAWMDKFHTANALIDQMIHAVRRISTDLRPSVLDDLGLIAALEWQLSEFTIRTEIQHEFATTVEYINMEMDTATAVFRIFQEALTNVLRHSGATKVAVVLREGERSLFGDESFVLEISDNGRGITEEEIMHPKSLGLLGMKERVMAFGGELSIRGEHGGVGTVLVIQIPRKQGKAS